MKTANKNVVETFLVFLEMLNFYLRSLGTCISPFSAINIYNIQPGSSFI